MYELQGANEENQEKRRRELEELLEKATRRKWYAV
jgi:hypothetical protein